MRFVTACLTGFLALSSAVLAGEPVHTIIDCPIGGSPVEVVQTSSCSYGSPDVELSMRRISSCDFVTRLPVCERADFPVYRRFTEAEQQQARQMVQEDWYIATQGASRYYRAYLIEKKLNASGEVALFNLLQSGYFFDPENTFGKEDYLAAFRAAANEFYVTAAAHDRKRALLAMAFAAVHSAEPEQAWSMLEGAKLIEAPNIPFFDYYLGLVEACVETPEAEACQPTYIVQIP